MSKMIFHESKVAAFSRDDGAVSELPISVYPNAHDSSDSISIHWAISVDDAEALAGALLAAAKAVRAWAAAPPPDGQDVGKVGP